jgi:hypothetical protein
MYKMNTRMLLAIVATTAVLTMMTSSIGVGIFSQHANATPCTLNGPNGNGAQVFKGGAPSPLPCEGNTCTINAPTGGVLTVTSKMHATLTPSGQGSLSCHS